MTGSVAWIAHQTTEFHLGKAFSDTDGLIQTERVGAN
jgi:hypothetical protein